MDVLHGSALTIVVAIDEVVAFARRVEALTGDDDHGSESSPIKWREVLYGGGTGGATEISRREFERLRRLSSSRNAPVMRQSAPRSSGRQRSRAGQASTAGASQGRQKPPEKRGFRLS